ncbi:glycosyltransferase family 2 protein [Streptomyces iranensis]|uniref:glycosyltransferase family 2 protein n=1 Tax=Streptomyces iranensis TaxID=576784 RepID=UPI0039B78A6F
MTRPGALAAHPHRSGMVFTGAVALILAAAWAAQHAVQAAHYGGPNSGSLAAVWTITFALLMLQTVMYHLERTRRLTPRIKRQLDALHVAILVPTYNEDPGYLRLGLQSFIAQSRRPDSVHVVDDGSTNTDYAEVRAWWQVAATEAGIATTWQRVPNAGKRHAQAHGVQKSLGADIYVTVDSDSCLAPNAIEQVLVPFARPRVQSVAGIVISTNHRANLLARITDLWFLTPRSGWTRRTRCGSPPSGAACSPPRSMPDQKPPASTSGRTTTASPTGPARCPRASPGASTCSCSRSACDTWPSTSSLTHKGAGT